MIFSIQPKYKFFLLVVLAVILLVGIGYLVLIQTNFFVNKNQPIACTTEAKLCPDGSYVGRVGPNCEFAACPQPGTNGWKTFTDAAQGIEFQYPEKLSTKFINAFTWPPKAIMPAGAFVCVEIPAQTSPAEPEVAKRTVDNRTYCVKSVAGGAAGSVYTDYTYIFEKDGKLISLSFTLQYPQCQNYDEPNQTDCAKERETFDLDSVIDRIAQTVKLK